MFYHHLKNSHNIIPALLIIFVSASVIKSMPVEQSNINKDEQICIEKFTCCLKHNDTCTKWCLKDKTCEIVVNSNINTNTEKSIVTTTPKLMTTHPKEISNHSQSSNQYNSSTTTTTPKTTNLNQTTTLNDTTALPPIPVGKIPNIGTRFVIQAPKVCSTGKQIDISGQCREVW